MVNTSRSSDTATDTAATADTLAPRGSACAQCGAPVEPGDKFCNACGLEQTPPPPTAPTTAEVAQKHFRCENCGAEISADADQRSFTCPFCDSTYVVEYSPEETGRQRPEFVIGFSVTLEQAQEKFQTWLSSNSFFRPSDLAMSRVVEKLRGVYLPFWSFSMLAQSKWEASIGEHWYRTETYTTTENGKTVTQTRQVQETEWWPLAGRHHQFYSGFLVSGSRGLKQSDAERIKPFQLPALKRYEPFYLAGWLSEEYSVSREAALQQCQQEFTRQEQENVGAFMPGDTYGKLEVETEFSHVNSDLVLLPIYLLSYAYQDKVYRFLVNGQTGKLAGDKPLSPWRIGIVVAGGLLLLAIVVLLVMWKR